MNANNAEPGLTGWLITQAIALLVFLGVPALVTAIAPVSWVNFQRVGDRVSVRASTCLLFVVPYKTVVVDSVIGVSERNVSGTTSSRRHGESVTRDRTKSEDQGFLVLLPPEPGVPAEVSVSPASLPGVLEQCRAFLKNPAEERLSLFVVANWKFSVIGGGIATFFAALYIVGATCGVALFLFRLVVPRTSAAPARA
ncbi:hypothetical protein DB346_07810 [Verrucomicrobia bacterium LW23]|nr:hypothetical protein DB346_07810 [Verrucomicrobia bacterium LW23]